MFFKKVLLSLTLPVHLVFLVLSFLLILLVLPILFIFLVFPFFRFLLVLLVLPIILVLFPLVLLVLLFPLDLLFLLILLFLLFRLFRLFLLFLLFLLFFLFLLVLLVLLFPLVLLVLLLQFPLFLLVLMFPLVLLVLLFILVLLLILVLHFTLVILVLMILLFILVLLFPLVLLFFLFLLLFDRKNICSDTNAVYAWIDPCNKDESADTEPIENIQPAIIGKFFCIEPRNSWNIFPPLHKYHPFPSPLPFLPNLSLPPSKSVSTTHSQFNPGIVRLIFILYLCHFNYKVGQFWFRFWGDRNERKVGLERMGRMDGLESINMHLEMLAMWNILFVF